MKPLTLTFLGIILLSKLISAQCYIQYTYDTSGNRTKREYVGGCAKPAPITDQAEAKVDSIKIPQ